MVSVDKRIPLIGLYSIFRNGKQTRGVNGGNIQYLLVALLMKEGPEIEQ